MFLEVMNIRIKVFYVSELKHVVNLTIAHLRIALLGGNPEVGNSEYMDHQNCPPKF